MATFDNIKKLMKMSQAERDALAEPSIMDDLPTNPEQDELIELAQGQKAAIENSLTNPVSGIITREKDIIKAAEKVLKNNKNPTRYDHLKAIDYKRPNTKEDFKKAHNSIDKLLEYSAKRRLGKEGSEMTEELAQDIQDTLHPYLSKTKLPIVHDSQLGRDGMRGLFRFREHPDFTKIQKAEEIRLKNPLDVATSEHEIGHYLDSLYRPGIKTNPVSSIEDVLRGEGDNALDLYSRRHHASVPGHFELDRATELLRDGPLNIPKDVIEQHLMQKQIFDNLIEQDLKDPKKAYDLLKKQQDNFSSLKSKLSRDVDNKTQQELDELLKELNYPRRSGSQDDIFRDPNVKGTSVSPEPIAPMDIKPLLKKR